MHSLSTVVSIKEKPSVGSCKFRDQQPSTIDVLLEAMLEVEVWVWCSSTRATKHPRNKPSITKLQTKYEPNLIHSTQQRMYMNTHKQHNHNTSANNSIMERQEVVPVKKRKSQTSNLPLSPLSKPLPFVNATCSIPAPDCTIEPQRKRCRHNRKVRFSPQVDTILPASNSDEGEDIVRAQWYSRSSYKEFEQECSRTIVTIHHKVNTVSSNNANEQQRRRVVVGSTSEHYTARGLEDLLSPERQRNRAFLKERHRHHVLMEQSIQRSHYGLVDPDHLAWVSQTYSWESSLVAQKRACRWLGKKED